MKRIVLASILGGIVFFIWSAIAHVATPLGRAGLSNLPNEPAITDALRANVQKPGLYFFPGMSAHPSADERQAWMDKLKSGPTGLLVVTSVSNGQAMSPRQLGLELLTNIVGAYLAAILAAMMVGTLIRRAVAIALLGIFASVSLSFSYWIWYGFDPAFVLAEMVTETVGWFLAGLVIAKLVPAAGESR